jgi:hypothetical protein
MWLLVGVYVGFLGVFVLLVCWLDPTQRRERRYNAELAARKPMADEEMVSTYFAEGTITPHVPGQVRRVIAQHMGYPAEKLLPDDDLMFYWAEVDTVELVKELEALFGITIPDVSAEGTTFTVRAISLLVEELMHRTSHNI